jgi:CBS domain-containing protein
LPLAQKLRGRAAAGATARAGLRPARTLLVYKVPQLPSQPQESDMQIREIMTENVKTVRPDTRLSDVACIMRDEDIGSVPVADGDRLVGMVTDRDIVVRAVAAGDGIERHTARDVMSPKILYCKADESVDDVLKNMGEQQIRRLPVVDRNMRLVGIVSLGDLSRNAPSDESGESLRDISSPSSQH